MTRAERLTLDAERALLARLEAEEYAGWNTVTPAHFRADIAALRRILQLLTEVVRGDESRHFDRLAHHPWNVWARTGQQKRAA